MVETDGGLRVSAELPGLDEKDVVFVESGYPVHQPTDRGQSMIPSSHGGGMPAFPTRAPTKAPATAATLSVSPPQRIAACTAAG